MPRARPLQNRPIEWGARRLAIQPWLGITLYVGVSLFPPLFLVTPAHSTERPHTTSPEVNIRWQDHRLTAHIDHAPLHVVLEQLGQTLPLSIDRPVTSEGHLLSLSFTNLELREALDRILAGHNYLLRTLPIKDQASGVSPPHLHLTILPAVAPNAPPPVAPSAEPENPLDEFLENNANRLHPSARLQALGQLHGTRARTEMAPILIAALQDMDPAIRSVAMKMLEPTSNDQDVLFLLREIARWDESPSNRVEALTLLSKNYPELATELLQQALHDSEETVRSTAQQLLEQLTVSSSQHP